MAKFCADCRNVSKFNVDEKPCSECYFIKNERGMRTKPKFQAKRKRGKHD